VISKVEIIRLKIFWCIFFNCDFIS